MRIGVGAVRKPDEPAYRRFATYDIVDPGKWTVDERRSDRIEFTHELGDTGGYAYVYRKTLRLIDDTLVLEHRLENTGRKPIATSVYNHNFFTLDHQTTGPDFVVRFPFEPRAAAAARTAWPRCAAGTWRSCARSRPRRPSSPSSTGSARPRSDYDFRIENRKTGAGVRVTGDRPLAEAAVLVGLEDGLPRAVHRRERRARQGLHLADHLRVLPGPALTFFTERTR